MSLHNELQASIPNFEVENSQQNEAVCPTPHVVRHAVCVSKLLFFLSDPVERLIDVFDVQHLSCV